MEDIMKIVKSLEESRLLTKGIIEKIKNEVKEQTVGFLGILLGTLRASLLRSALKRRGAGEGIIRAGQTF